MRLLVVTQSGRLRSCLTFHQISRPRKALVNHHSLLSLHESRSVRRRFLPSNLHSHNKPFSLLLDKTRRPWHNNDAFMNNTEIFQKEAWLTHLIQNEPQNVDTHAYLVILNALAESQQGGAPQRAEEWLNKMKTSQPGLKPSTECYNAVMRAWANSRKDDARLSIVRVERWFSELSDPNRESYHALLKVLSRGDSKLPKRDKNKLIFTDHAKRAEAVLNKMIATDHSKPTTESYNYVLRAWTRCRFCTDLVVERVMSWLKSMEKQSRTDISVQPNTMSYAIAMDAWSIFAAFNAKKSKPNKNQKTGGGGLYEAEQVEAILKYMHDLHTAGVENVVPNTVAYNTAISTWTRLAPFYPDAPLKAEHLLRKMISLRDKSHDECAPDQLSFTKVIMSWAKSKNMTSGPRALYWLNRLRQEYESQYQAPTLKPQADTYNAVMKAFGDDAKNVEDVFILLLQAEKTDADQCPNTESFSILIHTWIKVDLSRALMWLEELISRESRGTGLTTAPDMFQGIIKAASGKPSIDMLELGSKAFEHYRDSRHRLDAMTFVSLFRLCVHSLSLPHQTNDRSACVQQLIQDCRNNGLVSRSLLKEIADGPVYHGGWTVEESATVIEEHFASWPLPSSWTRNITDRDQMPQKGDTIRKNNSIRYRYPDQ